MKMKCKLVNEVPATKRGKTYRSCRFHVGFVPKGFTDPKLIARFAVYGDAYLYATGMALMPDAKEKWSSIVMTFL